MADQAMVAARWAAVADALREQGCPVVFTGAPEDQGCVDEIFRCLKGPAARLDGKLDLKTLAAVFERASVVVSTDTGPMHISAAVNTRWSRCLGRRRPIGRGLMDRGTGWCARGWRAVPVSRGVVDRVWPRKWPA
jgi:heptosyltransferase I